MPECLLRRYIDKRRSIQAMRILDMAEAGVYPQLIKAKGGGDSWWARWTEISKGTVQAAQNNMRSLKRWLRGVMGSGYSE